jgi:hypothetical protein
LWLIYLCYLYESIIKNSYNNPNVKGLFYLAAFAPDGGQPLTDFVDSTKLPNGFLVFDSGGFVYINLEMFPQAFTQDVDPAHGRYAEAD